MITPLETISDHTLINNIFIYSLRLKCAKFPLGATLINFVIFVLWTQFSFLEMFRQAKMAKDGQASI